MMQVGRIRLSSPPARTRISRRMNPGNFTQRLMRRYAPLWQRWGNLTLVFRRIRPVSQYFISAQAGNLSYVVQQRQFIQQSNQYTNINNPIFDDGGSVWEIVQQMNQHLSRQLILLNRGNSITYSRSSLQNSRQAANRTFTQRTHFHVKGMQLQILSRDRVVDVGTAGTPFFTPMSEADGYAAAPTGILPVKRHLIMNRREEKSPLGIAPESKKQLMIVRRTAGLAAVGDASHSSSTLERQTYEAPQGKLKTPEVMMDINVITEKVIQAIDRRVLAHRERMGRV